MTRFAAPLLALLLLFVAAPAVAQSNLKIAVVDLQQALNDVDEGKKAKATLETRMEEAQTRIKTLEGELEQMQRDLEAQQVMLSADALKEKQDALQGKMMEYQQMAYQTQQELAAMEQELTGDILGKLLKVAQGIGAEDNYNLVIERSAVVYINGAMDITTKVISRFNSK